MSLDKEEESMLVDEEFWIAWEDKEETVRKEEK